MEELRQVLRRMKNWRAPGSGGIQNFWYKKMYSTHRKLTEMINEVIHEPEKMPDFLTKGITYLMPAQILLITAQ